MLLALAALVLLPPPAAAARAPRGAPADALVVVACDCERRHPASSDVYSEEALRRHLEQQRRTFPNLRIVLASREDACGGAWAGGGARAGGGAALVWCAARGTCEAVRALAAAGGAPLAPECLRARALPAALVHLAAALRWRRVALFAPIGSRGAEAAEGCWRIARALSAAGVRTTLNDAEEPLQPPPGRPPHGIIVCASRGLGETVEILRALDAMRVSARIVVVAGRRESTPRARRADRLTPFEDTSVDSDITLDVITLPYVLRRENTFATTFTSSFDDFLSSSKTFSQIKNYTARKYENTERSSSAVRKALDNVLEVPKLLKDPSNMKADAQKIPEKRQTGTVAMKEKRPAGGVDLRGLSRHLQERLLLLAADAPPPAPARDPLAGLLAALAYYGRHRSHDPEASVVTYFLYDRLYDPVRHNDATPSWRLVTEFRIVTANASYDEDDFLEELSVNNTRTIKDLDGWLSARSAPAHEDADDGLPPAAVVFAGLVALLLLAGCIQIARYLISKGFSKGRSDIILEPSDFAFPPAAADDMRVDEGMETMLSCWLQQLHEFGGPDLERPDLLKQPPAPAAPSAPSSTCSINRAALDHRTRYKGDVVQTRRLPVAGTLEPRRKALVVLAAMRGLRHENVNPFLGCVCAARPALVFEHCGRGSLEDVLRADDIKLDWTFRLSLLTDLVKGMRYVHCSTLRVHGRLTSRNCAVDSRWVLRITDYGMPGFYRAQGLPSAPRRPRDLLWTAPELLREGLGDGRSSQAGDVFSFAIIMQEVIVRGEPYCMLALTPEEIVEKLTRPPPLIRPSVSMSAAPPEAVSVMRQCWSEQPDMRPDFHDLHDLFRHLHRGRKINIIDSMFEMLEKYSNNLEELIKERTEQLDMEKKKTIQLLNRMLPSSVAERLLAGSRVEPEEFEEVTVYFSDIVGFTALAALSTPVQVVDLLNDLYTCFDAAIQQYGVYKVETIGDAYMVVGGLPERGGAHAEQVATMALHLLHEAGRFRIRHLPATPLHLRSGVHTGPCCAAVVGLTMPRYCLFGDTVNTAARMESTGAAWRVQVSATTAARLRAAGGYRLRSRGLRQVKGKGAMHTYWLLGKDGFDRPLPAPPPLPPEEAFFERDADSDFASSPSDDGTRQDADDARTGALPDPSESPSEDAGAPAEAGSSRSSSVDSALPPPPRIPTPTPSHDRNTSYGRYRRSAARALRRQWSVERAEEAEARLPRQQSAGARASPPLALGAAAAPAAARRYRTRAASDQH